MMNKQRERHMQGGADHDAHGPHHMPHIHIHSHEKGHTVHVMHRDGTHEKHDHSHGDVEGIKAHIDQHLQGEQRPEQDMQPEHEGFEAIG